MPSSPGDLPPPRDWTQVTHISFDSLPFESPGKPKNIGVGSLSLLQGIFVTQELDRGLLHCRQILYQLIYQGSTSFLNPVLKKQFSWEVADTDSSNLPNTTSRGRVLHFSAPSMKGGFPGDASGKESTCQCKRWKRCGFDPWSRRISGAGNGSPLQYCCLGNPTDRGAREAKVHGAAKSRTWLSTQYSYGDLILGQNMQTKL